jgi:hypothetical protein
VRDLIEALTILAAYADPDARSVTGCEHDELYVYLDPARVTAADKDRLNDLGFHASEHDEHFYSFRFGSA